MPKADFRYYYLKYVELNNANAYKNDSIEDKILSNM